MPRGGTDRIERLHQPFERNVGMGERRQIAVAHGVEQCGESGGRIDLGAQHQSIDEHADQLVEGAVTAACDRGADRDIGARRQPCQQRREGRVHHHEQRRAPFPAELGQAGV